MQTVTANESVQLTLPYTDMSFLHTISKKYNSVNPMDDAGDLLYGSKINITKSDNMRINYGKTIKHPHES